jgi:hypothetical protein
VVSMNPRGQTGRMSGIRNARIDPIRNTVQL